MKVSIKNLGILHQADFEVKDLTIICGANNTGKTYATYALYGFLAMQKNRLGTELICNEKLHDLSRKGIVKILCGSFNEVINEFLKYTCEWFVEYLPNAFGTHESAFIKAYFDVDINISEAIAKEHTLTVTDLRNVPRFELTKLSGESFLSIKLVSALSADEIEAEWPILVLNEAISVFLGSILFAVPYIASTARADAATFQKELDISRNRIIEYISTQNRNINSLGLFESLHDRRYSWPVKQNVDFVRDLENIAKTKSYIDKKHQDIIDLFTVLAGGTYKATKEGVYFVPKKSGKSQLTMGESASSVRSLLYIGMFIKHIAQPGHLLMIDEPELNLHPTNQRMMARLIAKLVNSGIRVFITTHSDYILREFNTLIMMHNLGTAANFYMQKHKYVKNELLDPNKIKAYIAKEMLVETDSNKKKTKRNVIVQAEIGSQGIEIEEFDTTINIMNKVQDDLLFSGGII